MTMFDSYHIHIHQGSKQLNKILKLLEMSKEILDQLMAKVDQANTSLTNIRADIIRIKDSLPTTGGLTAEEVTVLAGRLDTLANDINTLDKENEPEAPEPEEPPVV